MLAALYREGLACSLAGGALAALWHPSVSCVALDKSPSLFELSFPWRRWERRPRLPAELRLGAHKQVVTWRESALLPKGLWVDRGDTAPAPTPDRPVTMSSSEQQQSPDVSVCPRDQSQEGEGQN